MDYCTSDLTLELMSETAVDSYWNEVGQVQDVTGHQQFPFLTRLAKAILVIPLYNAVGTLLQYNGIEQNQTSKQTKW